MEEMIEYILQFGDLNKQQIRLISDKATEITKYFADEKHLFTNPYKKESLSLYFVLMSICTKEI